MVSLLLTQGRDHLSLTARAFPVLPGALKGSVVLIRVFSVAQLCRHGAQASLQKADDVLEFKQRTIQLKKKKKASGVGSKVCIAIVRKLTPRYPEGSSAFDEHRFRVDGDK